MGQRPPLDFRKRKDGLGLWVHDFQVSPAPAALRFVPRYF